MFTLKEVALFSNAVELAILTLRERQDRADSAELAAYVALDAKVNRLLDAGACEMLMGRAA